MLLFPYIERGSKKERTPEAALLLCLMMGQQLKVAQEDSSRKGDSKGLSSDLCPGVLNTASLPPNHTDS